MRSNSVQETKILAKNLAKKIKPGMVIALNGDLGAGKTTFVQALVAALGSQEIVTSPTFVLLNVYKAKLPVYHFDIYRLSSIEDLENIGGEELIPSKDGVTIIEWADKIPEILPKKYIHIQIDYIDETIRDFLIEERS